METNFIKIWIEAMMYGILAATVFMSMIVFCLMCAKWAIKK